VRPIAIFLDSLLVQCNHRPTPGLLQFEFLRRILDAHSGAIMYRSIAAALALLSAMVAFAAHNPSPKTAPPKTPASVKLWVDSTAANACEQATPASGDWMIRNNEGRDVLVTMHRTTTKDGVSKEDETRDTLGPRESRELGCEISENGHQTLTIVRATF
jgi:hypothetical protein